ncbi:DUF6525 family protein [Paenirhodobacter populi]
MPSVSCPPHPRRSGLKRNLASSLRKRWRGDPMAAHDRLPEPARNWCARAVLPWSAASVGRIWARAMAETGSEEAALARLDAVQDAMLARDRH